MTREKKRSMCESFIKSSNFGLDTWMIIHRFITNAETLLYVIDVYQGSVQNLDKNEIVGNLKQQNILMAKQDIILDIVVKLVILIEVMLVFVDALSTGNYESIPKKITYYSLESVYQYIQKIRDNKYDWRRVLGLLQPSELPLSKEEQYYLFKDYEKNYAMIRGALLKLAEFYDKFRIIYGKYKHGLTIQLGLVYHSSSEIPELEKSILVSYDRKQKGRMPKCYVESIPSRDYSSYFNALGILSFNQQLLDEINSTILGLKYIISYICHNHLTYAKNCGKSYLPYIIENNRIAIRFTPHSETSESDNSIRQIIAEKIAPLINPAEDKLTTNFNTTRQEIFESISRNSVTNVWLSTK